MIDNFIEGQWTDMIRNSVVIENGHIIGHHIKVCREAKNLLVK